MVLAEAAKPRVFTDKDWYKDTAKSMQKYQRQAVERDDTEKQRQKQKYLDDLKVCYSSILKCNFNSH